MKFPNTHPYKHNMNSEGRRIIVGTNRMETNFNIMIPGSSNFFQEKLLCGKIYRLYFFWTQC